MGKIDLIITHKRGGKVIEEFKRTRSNHREPDGGVKEYKRASRSETWKEIIPKKIELKE